METVEPIPVEDKRLRNLIRSAELPPEERSRRAKIASDARWGRTKSQEKCAPPAELLERYTAALNDPDLLSLRRDIALADSRIEELKDRLASGENDTAWMRIRSLLDTPEQLQKAITEATTDPTKVPELLGKMQKASAAAHQQYTTDQTWLALQSAQTHKANLVTREHRRLVELEGMMSAEQGVAFMRAVLLVVRREVKDIPTLERIADGSKLLLSQPRASREM